MTFADYLKELGNPSRPLSTSKLVNLTKLAPSEKSVFLDIWSTIDVGRRRQIIDRLTELAEDNVELNFDEVFLAALNDPDPGVRVRAIRGLWEYEGPDLIDHLLGLLERDTDPGVRAEAALGLGRFVVLAEFDALRESDVQRVDAALRRVIADPLEAVEVRARAIEAVGARSEPWVPSIIRKAYDSRNHRLRVSALHAMGRSCDSRWLSILISELRNEDPEIRYEAAIALGEIGEEEAVPYLIELLEDDDAEVQEMAISALGEIGGRRARTALQHLTKHPSERIREAAATALEMIAFNDDPLGFTFRF